MDNVVVIVFPTAPSLIEHPHFNNHIIIYLTKILNEHLGASTSKNWWCAGL